MKNLIVSFVAVIAVCTSPAFAQPANNEKQAQTVFAQEFPGAENIMWTKLNGGFLKASFIFNGIRTEAYFNADAEPEGALRNLFYNQLPLAVMQGIRHRFGAAVITEIKEISNPEETSYSIILEQNNKTYHLKLNSLGEIVEQRKEKLKR